VAEADKCTETGAVGALLRREGISPGSLALDRRGGQPGSAPLPDAGVVPAEAYLCLELIAPDDQYLAQRLATDYATRNTQCIIGLPAAAQHLPLDLLDEKWQIGLGKGGDALVLDVRGDVFVLGMGASLEQLIDQEL